MKKRNSIFKILVFGLALLMVVGCSDDNEKYADLTVSTETVKVRTIEPDPALLEIDHYIFKATYQNGKDKIEKTFTGPELKLTGVKVGYWEVFVEGYNSSNSKVAESVVTPIDIAYGVPNSIRLSVKYNDNTADGTFAITVKIPVGDTTTYKISCDLLQEQQVVQSVFKTVDQSILEETYHSFKLAGTCPYGTYDVKIRMYDESGNQVINEIVETMSIYGGAESSKVLIVPTDTMYANTPIIKLTYSEKGVDDRNVLVEMSTTTPGATIRYTLDGVTPSGGEGQTYTDKFYITSFYQDIKARSIKKGMIDSPVAEDILCYRGDAGGYIVYDCDADNTISDPDGSDNLSSEKNGWRYLEAAPHEMRLVAGVPTIDSLQDGYESGDREFIYGKFRPVDTTDTEVGSKSNILGEGYYNTVKLTSCMLGKGYYGDGANRTFTPDYAANLCKKLEYGGYTDWFFPNLREMYYVRYYLDTIVPDENRWSSDEYNEYSGYFHKNLWKTSSDSVTKNKDIKLPVWPVRCMFIDKPPMMKPELKIYNVNQSKRVYIIYDDETTKAYYTLDNTNPSDIDSTKVLYTGPFDLSSNCTLNVVVERDGVYSSVVTQAITFQ